MHEPLDRAINGIFWQGSARIDFLKSKCYHGTKTQVQSFSQQIAERRLYAKGFEQESREPPDLGTRGAQARPISFSCREV